MVELQIITNEKMNEFFLFVLFTLCVYYAEKQSNH